MQRQKIVALFISLHVRLRPSLVTGDCMAQSLGQIYIFMKYNC